MSSVGPPIGEDAGGDRNSHVTDESLNGNLGFSTVVVGLNESIETLNDERSFNYGF